MEPKIYIHIIPFAIYVIYYLFNWVYLGKAQSNVTITYDPPSPVPLGITKFMCEFTLGTFVSVKCI